MEAYKCGSKVRRSYSYIQAKYDRPEGMVLPYIVTDSKAERAKFPFDIKHSKKTVPQELIFDISVSIKTYIYKFYEAE